MSSVATTTSAGSSASLRHNRHNRSNLSDDLDESFDNDRSYFAGGQRAMSSQFLEYSDTEASAVSVAAEKQGRVFQKDTFAVNNSQFIYNNQQNEPLQRVVKFPEDAASKKSNWMQQIAYSFGPRSDDQEPQHHKRLSSGGGHAQLREYPHTPPPATINRSAQITINNGERQTLLSKKGQAAFHCAMAATFLHDYQANRPPSLTKNLASITHAQLAWHKVKFHSSFSAHVVLATCALFVSGGLEHHPVLVLLLNAYGLLILAIDLWLRHQLRGPRRSGPRVRPSRSGKLIVPLITWMIVFAAETIARYLAESRMTLVSGLFKPLVLFYVSYQARDALEALARILVIVGRVLMMELLLILMFAAVAVRLFGEFDHFENLSASWLSLFQLSTTVVNPSLWLPMYEKNKYSACFFMFFVVTSVFYFHSLVLSVVFQTYVLAATETHERSVADREDAAHLAYIALKQEDKSRTVIDIELVRETLQILRPHYSSMKINALVEIMDPSNQGEEKEIYVQVFLLLWSRLTLIFTLVCSQAMSTTRHFVPKSDKR
jgi:hypothetical protein